MPTPFKSESTVLDQLKIRNVYLDSEEDEFIYLEDLKQGDVLADSPINTTATTDNNKVSSELKEEAQDTLIEETRRNNLKFNRRGLVGLGSYNQIIITLDSCDAMDGKYPIFGHVHPSTLHLLDKLENFDSTPVLKRLKTKIMTGLIRTPTSKVLDEQQALMTCNLDFAEGGLIRSLSLPQINPHKVKPKWPARLVIVRHGQSEQNAALDLCQDDIDTLARVRDADINLTSAGIWQCKQTGAYLKDTGKFDICFTSPYNRAVDTANNIISQLPYKLKVYKDNWLREKEFGRAHGLTEKLVRDKFPDEYAIRNRDGKYWYRFPGGENYLDVEMRIHCFLEKLSRDYAGRSVLVVTHQIPYKLFRGLFHHLDEHGLLALEAVHNCGIQEYILDTSKAADGRMKMKHFNYKAYDMKDLPKLMRGYTIQINSNKTVELLLLAKEITIPVLDRIVALKHDIFSNSNAVLWATKSGDIAKLEYVVAKLPACPKDKEHLVPSYVVEAIIVAIKAKNITMINYLTERWKVKKDNGLLLVINALETHDEQVIENIIAKFSYWPPLRKRGGRRAEPSMRWYTGLFGVGKVDLVRRLFPPTTVVTQMSELRGYINVYIEEVLFGDPTALDTDGHIEVLRYLATTFVGSVSRFSVIESEVASLGLETPRIERLVKMVAVLQEASPSHSLQTRFISKLLASGSPLVAAWLASKLNNRLEFFKECCKHGTLDQVRMVHRYIDPAGYLAIWEVANSDVIGYLVENRFQIQPNRMIEAAASRGDLASVIKILEISPDSIYEAIKPAVLGGHSHIISRLVEMMINNVGQYSQFKINSVGFFPDSFLRMHEYVMVNYESMAKAFGSSLLCTVAQVASYLNRDDIVRDIHTKHPEAVYASVDPTYCVLAGSYDILGYLLSNDLSNPSSDTWMHLGRRGSSAFFELFSHKITDRRQLVCLSNEAIAWNRQDLIRYLQSKHLLESNVYPALHAGHLDTVRLLIDEFQLKPKSKQIKKMINAAAQWNLPLQEYLANLSMTQGLEALMVVN
eukprot:gene10562-12287_t